MSRDIEVQRLHIAWKKVLSVYFVNTDDEHASHVEDDARNALVDFVEANNLNGSHWDPRGPMPEDDDSALCTLPDCFLHSERPASCILDVPDHPQPLITTTGKAS